MNPNQNTKSLILAIIFDFKPPTLVVRIFELLKLSIILQRTSTDNTKPKVAESENIGANHLGFTKSLFQHYCQYLGLNHNHISAKSAFNFYVNKKIFSLLGTPINTKSARETFYKKLIQNTNILTNHNFTSIIIEINKKIEHYTQQRYPITYASKGKGKLQTPAVIPRKIQPPAWKKNRVESPSNPSYHYTLGSAINISSTDAFPSTVTSAFGQFSFQNRQRKAELLGPYGKYFEGFNSRSLTPSGLRSPPPPPDFGISDPWEAAESEKKEKESENQEFTYQHPITKNLEPPQPPNLDPMAYTPIAKLDNFTGEEDDTQVWLNNVKKAIAANEWNDARAMQAIPYFLKNTANSWYQSLINKPQDFNAFKVEFLRYFNNNNSINCLVNTFTTIKQRETKAILNQFIHGLRSSILQHVCLLHPSTLQNAVTCARDFKSAKSETNHAQAVNLEKFSESINKKLEGYLVDNYAIYQPPQ
ncbi:hypothetical protein G9A89_006346 [Geosiphon pyriformis]|nr:hypothetical protein G9A89_006346 [Geosiphon pyriformis]